MTRREARLLQQQAEAATATTPPLVEPESPATPPTALIDALRFAPPPTQPPADYHPAPAPAAPVPAPDLGAPLGARWVDDAPSAPADDAADDVAPAPADGRVFADIAVDLPHSPVEESDSHAPTAESVDESFAALFGSTETRSASPAAPFGESAESGSDVSSVAGPEPEAEPVSESASVAESPSVAEFEPEIVDAEIVETDVETVIEDSSVAAQWPFAFGAPSASPSDAPLADGFADAPPAEPTTADPVAATPAVEAPAEPVSWPSSAGAPADEPSSEPSPTSEAAAASADEPGEGDFLQPPVARTSYTPPATHWSRMGEDEDGDVPVETTLSRQVGASNITTTSAIILPSIPQGDFASVINATGEILVTGTIQLPESLGSLGGDARNLDHPDVDRLLDSLDADVVSNDSAPVRAIRAVSTHTATNSVITPPQKPKGNRWWIAGGIAVGALIVAVVSLLAIYVIKM